MAFGPIISWQMGGGKVETVTYLIFLGSKFTGSPREGPELLCDTGKYDRRSRDHDRDAKSPVYPAERVPAGKARERPGRRLMGTYAQRCFLGTFLPGRLDLPVYEKTDPFYIRYEGRPL